MADDYQNLAKQHGLTYDNVIGAGFTDDDIKWYADRKTASAPSTKVEKTVAPTRETGGSGQVARDYAGSLGKGLSGLGQLGGRAIDIAGNVLPDFDGVEDNNILDRAGQKIEKFYKGREEKFDKQLSKEFKAEQSKQFGKHDGSFLGSFTGGEAWKSPEKIAGMLTESAPSTVLSMASGGAFARGLVALGAKISPWVGGLLTSMVGEGSISGAQSGKDIYDKVAIAPLEQLRKTDEFNNILNGITEGTQQQREEQARKELAGDVSTKFGLLIGAFTSATGITSGKLLGDLARKKFKGNIVEAVIKGAALEAPEEAIQSMGEQLGGNIPTQRFIDPNMSLTEGLGEAGAGGFVSGAAMGGPMAGAFYQSPTKSVGAVDTTTSDFTKATTPEILKGRSQDDVLAIRDHATSLLEKDPENTDLLSAVERLDAEIASRTSPLRQEVNAEFGIDTTKSNEEQLDEIQQKSGPLTKVAVQADQQKTNDEYISKNFNRGVPDGTTTTQRELRETNNPQQLESISDNSLRFTDPVAWEAKKKEQQKQAALDKTFTPVERSKPVVEKTEDELFEEQAKLDVSVRQKERTGQEITDPAEVAYVEERNAKVDKAKDVNALEAYNPEAPNTAKDARNKVIAEREVEDAGFKAEARSMMAEELSQKTPQGVKQDKDYNVLGGFKAVSPDWFQSKGKTLNNYRKDNGLKKAQLGVSEKTISELEKKKARIAKRDSQIANGSKKKKLVLTDNQQNLESYLDYIATEKVKSDPYFEAQTAARAAADAGFSIQDDTVVSSETLREGDTFVQMNGQYVPTIETYDPDKHVGDITVNSNVMPSKANQSATVEGIRKIIAGFKTKKQTEGFRKQLSSDKFLADAPWITKHKYDLNKAIDAQESAIKGEALGKQKETQTKAKETTESQEVRKEKSSKGLSEEAVDGRGEQPGGLEGKENDHIVYLGSGIRTQDFVTLGKQIYKAGMSLQKFAQALKKKLGKVFAEIKNKVKPLFEMLSKPLANQEGALGDKPTKVAKKKAPKKPKKKVAKKPKKKNPKAKPATKKKKQQTLLQTTSLNATKDGVTSTTSAEKGRKIVQDILYDLRKAASPSRKKLYEGKVEQELLDELDKVMGVMLEKPKSKSKQALLDSISSKQQFAVNLAKKFPKIVKGELLVQLKSISKPRSERVIQRKVNEFLDKAHQKMNSQLAKDVAVKVEKVLKPPKPKVSGGKKYPQGRGAKVEAELSEISKYTTLSQKKVDANIAFLEQSLEKLKKKLENVKGKVAKGKSFIQRAENLQIEIDDIQSDINYYTTFGNVKGMTFSEASNALATIENIIENEGKSWRDAQEAHRAKNKKNISKTKTGITDESDPTIERQEEKNKRRAKEGKLFAWKKGKGVVWQAKEFASNGIQSFQLTMDKINKQKSKIMRSWLVDYWGSVAHYGERNEEDLRIKSGEKISNKAVEIFGKDANKKLRKYEETIEGAITLHETQEYTDKNSDTQERIVERQIDMSPMEVAYLYLVDRGRYGDKSVQKTLANMGVTFETRQQMSDLLTDELKEWSHWIQDELLTDIHNDVNAVYSAQEGVNLKNIDGYIPLNRIFSGEGVSRLNHLKSFLQKQTEGLNKASSFSERTGSTTEFDLSTNLNSMLLRHVADMNHYIAWAAPSREINATFNNAEVRALIEQHHGDSVLNAVVKFQEDFSSGSSRALDDFAFLDKLRANITVAMVGGNPITALKQQASIPAFAAEIPIMDWLVGTAHAMRHPIKSHKFMMEHSPIYRGRGTRGYSKDIADIKGSGESAITGIKDIRDIRELSMIGTKFSDKMAIIAGGFAVYSYHYMESLKNSRADVKAGKITAEQAEEQAIEEGVLRFEMTSQSTQQSPLGAYRGHFLKGDAKQNLFTVFITSPASYARMLEMYARHWHEKGNMAHATKGLVIYGLVLPSLFAAIGSGLWGDDEEEFEQFADAQFQAIGLSYLNGIPFVRDIAKGVINILQGNGWFNTEFSPMVEPYNEATKLISNTMKAVTGGTEQISAKEYGKRAFTNFVHETGYLTGVPTKPVGRWTKGVYDATTGEADHPLLAMMGFSEWARGDKDRAKKASKRINKIKKLRKEYKKARGQERAKIRADRNYKFHPLASSYDKKLRRKRKTLSRLEKNGKSTKKTEESIKRLHREFLEKTR